MNEKDEDRMRQALDRSEESLRRAKEEIAKTLSFLEEVRRVEEVIARHEQRR